MRKLEYDGPLKAGLFMGPNHRTNLDPTLGYQRDLKLVDLLEELCYDEAWFGEHHSGGFETITTPELMIAAAAERTKHIKLGTGVKSVPYHNPLIVSECMAQLDHMTRGRAIFGVGPGALETDANMMGMTAAQLRPRLGEALDAIVPLLRNKTVTKETDWYDLKEARLHVGSYTKPMMDMAVTSVRSPAGVEVAGRHGLGVLTLGGIDDASLDRHRHNWDIYEEVCAAHGQIADRSRWRITCFMHLAQTREQALEDVKYGIKPWVQYTHDVVSAGGIVPLDVENPGEWLNETNRGIVGTADDAIEQIERIREALGGFGVILFFGHDWADWAATQRSFQIFAELVKPHLNDSNRMRQESYERCSVQQEENVLKVRAAIAAATEDFESRRSP